MDNNKKNKLKRKNKGSVLAYALVIMFVVSIILTSMVSYIVSQLKFSINRVNRAEAFQIAEAGVFYYRWYLAHETAGKTAQQIQDFWNTGNPLGVESSNPIDYNGLGQYKLVVTAPSQGSTIVIVKSTGWTYKDANSTRTVQVRFRRPSWSEYMFLSNSFMNFGSAANVYGKVFSNDGIRFDGVAHNTVSSLLPSFVDSTWNSHSQFGVHTTDSPADPNAPSYPWPAGTVPNRPDVFMGGRNFPVPQVSFTGVTTDLVTMKSQAQSGNGKYFDNTGVGQKILLKSDGTYDVCKVSAYNSSSNDAISSYAGVVTGATGSYNSTNGSSCTVASCCSGSSCPYVKAGKSASGRCVSLTNYPIVNNGVIFVENNAWVDGAVNNKRATIVAENIYIGTENSSITYANLDCNNMLGLVTQQDIRVLNSCPSNYTVDAALLAQAGTVAIVDSGFNNKTSLTINGAIASYLQPYFYYATGFANRTYNFNNNLLYCPPPYFPTGTDYSIDLWEEL